jgi:hypothetical protein
VIFADHDFQETKLLDEFVEDSVMRWVRMIVARHPDAEFVFIATKEDALGDNKVTEELLRQFLMEKLKDVNKAARQMKEPGEKNEQVEYNAYEDIEELLTMFMGELEEESQRNTPHVANRPVGVAMTEPSVVFVSCASIESTKAARTKIKALVIESGYSFEMPDTYTRVLKEIVKIREAARPVVSLTGLRKYLRLWTHSQLSWG